MDEGNDGVIILQGNLLGTLLENFTCFIAEGKLTGCQLVLQHGNSVMNEETPVNQMTTVQDITQCIDQSGRNTVLVVDEQVIRLAERREVNFQLFQ